MATSALLSPAYELDPGLTSLLSAAVSASGRLAVTYGTDAAGGRLTVWELPGLARGEFATPLRPLAARFTPDERELVAALRGPGDSAEVRRWRPGDPGTTGELIDAQRDVGGIAVSRDAGTAVYRWASSGLSVLSTADGATRGVGHPTRFSRVAISPRGAQIAAVNQGSVESFDTATGAFRWSSELAGATSFDCSEGTIFVAAGTQVWEVAGAGARRVVSSGSEPVVRIAAYGDGGVVALAYEKETEIVSLEGTAGPLRIAAPSPVQRLTFSLGGDFLVTAHDDGVARIWQLPGGSGPDEAGQLLRRLGPSALAVLQYADDIREEWQQDVVHMDYLLLALSDGPDDTFRELLSGVGVPARQLRDILPGMGGLPVPVRVTRMGPGSLPPLSAHVMEALRGAAALAGRLKEPKIRAEHLLYAALSVTDCAPVQALAARGIRRSGPAEWAGLLPEKAPPPRPVLLAGAAADTVPRPGEPGQRTVRNADRLDVAADVDMLTSVLLARDTPMPLAVGLFGDWGSGKSFFMALMRERISELTALAADGKAEAEPFCCEVRQVLFNAWHYVDTSLWASLAAALFDQLAHAGAPTPAQVKLEQIGEARQRARQARQEREKIEDEVTQLAARANRADTVIRVSVGAAIHAVRDDPDLHAELREAARQGESSGTTAQLVTALGDIDTAAGKAAAAWRLLEEEALHRRRWLTLITLLVLAGAAVFASVAASWPAGLKVVSFLGAAAVGLTPALSGAARVLYLVREARERREVPLAGRLDELAQARAREEQAQVQVAQEERELALLRDRGLRLQEFVRGRAASLDYRGRLGVISQVRSDFEELSALLPGGVPADELPADEGGPARTPKVERIMLFIDDLDRCPPGKVVEVLQAVHLLLAFPLFAVVVGVDSEWLVRSLKAHYREVLEEPASYLEKIFQVPFQLRAMTPASHQALVERLLEPPASASASSGAAPAEAAAERPSVPAARSPGDEESAYRPPDAPSAPPGPGVPSAGRAVIPPPPPPSAPRPERLEISGPERELLGRVGAVVPTPRATKRLLNVYRMLRVSVPDDELQAFLPDGGREYEAVVVLLAILIGRPSRARGIFGKLADAADDADAWEILGDAAAELREHIAVSQAGPYRRWAPRVARFSFRFQQRPADPGPGA